MDVLESAHVVSTLEEAINDCSLVIGTSARSRTYPRPVLNAKESAEKLFNECEQGPVAILFGRERMGLTSQQLEACQYHTEIPAHPDYPILNVSAAIQIFCYEIWQANNNTALKAEQASNIKASYPTYKETQSFYQHLEETLTDTNFLFKNHKGEAMTRLKRLINRIRPEQKEVRMIRGALNSIQDVVKHQKTEDK